MVRTVKSHRNEDDEVEEYHDFASSAPDDSSNKGINHTSICIHIYMMMLKAEERSGEQKLRSKHSETEQRRRSKINERFQILRDLIPENDQKRDKASFLLEVIQYIHFLQEKLQIYEGAYQGWSPELSKLVPWRSNSGAVESFVEQSPLIRDECNLEDNIAVTPRILNNSHNSIESDLSGTAVCKLGDRHHGSADQAIPLNMPLQPTAFENMSAQNQGSLSDNEHLASHSQSQYFSGKWSTECTIPRYTLNEQEDLRNDSGEANLSNAYSQGLLNTITRALQSSGVDLSQASISVQLDIGRQTNSGNIAAAYSAKGFQNQDGVQSMAQFATSGESYDHGHKRLRTEES